MHDHRALAVSLFNRTWDYLRMDDRTAVDNDEMLSMAHASAYHWRQVGKPENFAISQWQISRVYAVLGRAQCAIHHGHRAIQIAAEAGLPAFYVAYAHEAVARGYLVAGDQMAMREHREEASRYLQAIEDPEELELLTRDLETLA
jgi:hypothetical protein